MGVIVAYHPDRSFSTVVERALDEVDTVVVVNNGPAETIDSSLQDLRAVRVIQNQTNAGQGTALNQACVTAFADADTSWCLLLDQDSILHEGYLKAIASAHDRAGGRSIGLIGGNPIYAGFGEFRFGSPNENPLTFERTLIQMSGSLISKATFAKVGLFREEFFIDSVDADYCLRTHQSGMRNLVVRSAVLDHAVGAATRIATVFNRRILVTNHSPARCYYMSRNGLTLVREHARSEPLWALRRLAWYFVVKPGLILLYEQQKATKLRELVRGGFHAVRGVTGQHR